MARKYKKVRVPRVANPVAKPKAPSSEFQAILDTADPIDALDQCQAKVKEIEAGYRARIWASLGAIAELCIRLTQDEKAWGRLVEKKRFWDDCEGERPTMDDRSDGIRFVVRYVRNAKKRPAAQKASKHAIVIKYLLDQGIEPAAIPAELAKPKNGINAICQKASGASSADTPEGNDRAKLTTDDTRIGTKAQPENDWSDDDNDWSDDDDDQPEAEVKGEQPSSEPQKLKVSGLVSLGLHGEAEIVKKEEAFQEDEEMFMRVRVRKTKSGKRYLKLLDVVPPLKLPKAVKASARMKNDPRDAKAASRRPSQGLH
jgi:hypothetical protein